MITRDVTARMRVTGTAQHEAWQARVLPPVEQVRPGLWSVPVPIPDNPLRYTLSYAFTSDTGPVIVDPGWDSAAGRQALTAGLTAAGATPRDPGSPPRWRAPAALGPGYRLIAPTAAPPGGL